VTLLAHTRGPKNNGDAVFRSLGLAEINGPFFSFRISMGGATPVYASKVRSRRPGLTSRNRTRDIANVAAAVEGDVRCG